MSAGELRYRMLEPVRQYAAERLAERGGAEETCAAHAGHYVQLAEAAYPRLEREEQIEWLDRLAAENDNLRAAITWAVNTGRTELAARFGWALRMYWLMRDRRREGRILMEAAAQHAGSAPDQVRARLLHVRAFCLYGYEGPHRELAEEGVSVFRQAGDEIGVEYSLGMLGFALLVEGSMDEATTVLRQALALTEQRGDDSNAAHLLNHLAVVPLRAGDSAEAASLAGQALERSRRTGERLAQQTSHQILAQTAWVSGGEEEALRRFQDSLGVATELSDTVNIAYSLRGIALCDGRRGRSAGAARLLGAADAALEEAGSPLFAWAVGALDAAVAEAVRVGSDDAAWRRGYDEGRRMGLDTVAAGALGSR